VIAISGQGTIYPSRLFNGSNQYQGQLQFFIDDTWQPVCYSDSLTSYTAISLCRHLGFKIALSTYEIAYSGDDAAFDYIYCYSNDISNCYYTNHTTGQCDSNATLGIACSDGRCICVTV